MYISVWMQEDTQQEKQDLDECIEYIFYKTMETDVVKRKTTAYI